MQAPFLSYARTLGLGHVRFGRGEHEKMKAALRFLGRRADDLQLEFQDGGYAVLL